MSTQAFVETFDITPGEPTSTNGKSTGAAIANSVRTLVGAVETQPSVTLPSEVPEDSVGDGDPYEVNGELNLPPL